jgi:hypothetical protein
MRGLYGPSTKPHDSKAMDAPIFRKVPYLPDIPSFQTEILGACVAAELPAPGGGGERATGAASAVSPALKLPSTSVSRIWGSPWGDCRAVRWMLDIDISRAPKQ